MASAARGESSNPYGGGLGTGGKFRKQTTRRSQKTPYDRPPTSLRNPGLGGGEGRGDSWFKSNFVDPAQKFITYSAHKLFASVFRKRLGSGETPLQSPEQLKQRPERDVNQEMKVGDKEDISNLSEKKDSIGIKDTNVSVDPTKDGLIYLEKILKEKTFTRSEVDRLTTLLRSKAANSSTVNEEQKNEVSIVVRHPSSHERDTLHPDNGSMNGLVSTPPGSSNAFNECIASPAQLAKAYMGSRPPEVIPMLGLRGQAVREDSVFLNRTPYLPKSPTMPVVPKPSGQRPVENGFVTPRSRGKSALYSMARTPYSRPQSTVKIGSLFQASPNTWEESLSSGLRQGYQTSLKRRSSVIDNDIGSVGPVRRIRQKSNLSSRSLALPASESPLSVRANGGKKITHTSKDSTEDIHGSSFNLVPTKSSEMASKILQQLDKLVSTREKSPSKLSPSMLRGTALNSLQNVEAPKVLDNIPEKKENSPGSSYQKQEKSKESGSREVLALNGKAGGAVEGSSKPACSKDQEAHVKGDYIPLTSSLEEHPPKKRAFRMSAHEDFLELEDDRGAASNPFEVAEKQNDFKVEQDCIIVPKGEKPLTLSEAIPSTTHISNGEASQSTSNGPLETGRNNFTAVPTEAGQQRIMASEPTSKFIQGPEKSAISHGRLISEKKGSPLEKPKKAVAVFPNIFPSPVVTDLSNQNNGASADIKLEKTSSATFGVSEVWAKPTEAKQSVTNSTSGAESATSAGANTVSTPLNNGSLGSSPFFPSSITSIPSTNIVSEVPSTVQSLAATPASSSVFGKLPANTSNDSNSGSNSQSTSAPPVSSTSSFKFGESAAPFSASTVSASSGQISKEAELINSTFGNINTFKFSGMASADPGTGNAFVAKSSEIKSTPGFMFGNSSPAVADTRNNIIGGTSSVVSGSTLKPSMAASSAPGSSGSSIFGVTSSSIPATEAISFSASSAATTGSNFFGTSNPAFTSSGSSMFEGVAASTGSSVFGFNAVSSASSAASSQSQATNIFGASNAQTGNTGSGTTTSTQSIPFQFGASASAPSFGMSGNVSLASNNSPFGFSKPEPAVFASGLTQQSMTKSSANSCSTTSSPLFGTSWQAPNSASNSAPVFSSSFTPSSSPTFSFGAASAASSSSASTPIFGFSSTAPSTPQQPVFGNSAPPVSPSQSLFGNSTPGFAFGATNTNGINNNQQVSMEDSMAEDTDQANKTSMVAPMFGQAAVSMPQPNFGFGGGAATPPPPSMANPFQFGGQPMGGTPQNASPFQVSQSLEFQGGGSFSLGSTGGGDKTGRRIYKAKKTNRKK